MNEDDLAGLSAKGATQAESPVLQWSRACLEAVRSILALTKDPQDNLAFVNSIDYQDVDSVFNFTAATLEKAEATGLIRWKNLKHVKDLLSLGKSVLSQYLPDLSPVRGVALGDSTLCPHLNFTPQDINGKDFEKEMDRRYTILQGKVSGIVCKLHCAGDMEDMCKLLREVTPKLKSLQKGNSGCSVELLM